MSVAGLRSPSYAAFATLAYVLVENAERDNFCLLTEARQRRIELLRRRNRDSIGMHRRHMGAYSFRVEHDTVFLSYRRMNDTIQGLYISRTMSARKHIYREMIHGKVKLRRSFPQRRDSQVIMAVLTFLSLTSIIADVRWISICSSIRRCATNRLIMGFAHQNRE